MSFVLYFSIFLISGMIIFIGRFKNKNQLHYVFLGNMICVLIWATGQGLDIFVRDLTGRSNMIIVSFYFLGVIYLPYFLLLTGLVYSKSAINFSYRHILLMVPQALTTIILFANNGLIFEYYSNLNTEIIYGKYLYIHTGISYIYILIGLTYLFYFTYRDKGLFSKQSFFVASGIFISFLVNFIVTLKMIRLPLYATPIAFTCSLILFFFAVFKFKFLNIIPIALKQVFDSINVSVLVVGTDLKIIDYNKSFETAFSSILPNIQRNIPIDSMNDVDKEVNLHLKKLNELLKKFINADESKSVEFHIKVSNFDKRFIVELSNLKDTNMNVIGANIMFVDITDLREAESRAMQNERLATLGQITAGVSHDLRTPIMAISGYLEGMKMLAAEYEESIGDHTVTEEDHKEISTELKDYIDKSKVHLSYMSEMIKSIKDMSVTSLDNSCIELTMDDVVKRINVLMGYQLKNQGCTLNIKLDVKKDLLLSGTFNSVFSILCNLIVNAIHASAESENKTIDFLVKRNSNIIEFVVKDYGKGIKLSQQKKIFKEQFTTKGKNGTGLGLFFSYITVKGKLNGDMWFVSKENEGTTFHVAIPFIIKDGDNNEKS